jgi:hypothetical protein
MKEKKNSHQEPACHRHTRHVSAAALASIGVANLPRSFIA